MVQLLMGVPTFYARLLHVHEFNRDTMAHIRLWISGSAPLSDTLREEFYRRCSHVYLTLAYSPPTESASRSSSGTA